MGKKDQQTGVVSIFAVIFSALIMSILTVSFIRLMVVDQKQASDNDLSQSAYDAALAGVEDAKRVLRASQLGNSTAIDAINNHHNKCDMIQRSGVAGVVGEPEVIVKSSSTTGAQFDQAYTCVKLDRETPDLLYKMDKDKSRVVPLWSKDTFNRIVIEWYKRDDESNPAQADATPVGHGDSLPAESQWGVNTPPLMRAQLINPGSTISSLDQFDATGLALFLRPNVVNIPPVSYPGINTIGNFPRATGGGEYNNHQQSVTCSKRFIPGGYSCRAIIKVSDITAVASKNTYLRLNMLYKGGSVRISLLNSIGNVVKFDGVQPAVDSTGRAANIFRRVEARLEMGSDFNYPDNAVELNNNLCKDFSVSESNYIPGSCQP